MKHDESERTRVTVGQMKICSIAICNLILVIADWDAKCDDLLHHVSIE